MPVDFLQQVLCEYFLSSLNAIFNCQQTAPSKLAVCVSPTPSLGEGRGTNQLTQYSTEGRNVTYPGLGFFPGMLMPRVYSLI